MNDQIRHQLANKIVVSLPAFGAWSTAINEYQTPFGKIGYRQIELLWAIRHHLLPKGATASAIAALYEIQPSVVTRVLAKLEARGFITRKADPADRRQFHIEITPLGEQVSKHVEELYTQEVLDQFALLDESEIERIAKAIDVLATLGHRLLNARKAMIAGQSQAISPNGIHP